MKEPKARDLIVRVADTINKKRREELLTVFSSSSEFQKYLNELKNSDAYRRPSKSGVWRKVASMPVIVDRFFSDLYGKDYYKDPNFFKKYAPEWMVFNPSKY